ncbi:hypothetical protein MTBLM5_450024 [Magnetospirillum sp. LM-5]|uniref:hypothetical protein n=1 Tax=Magnetospirillum sp. LM-5 TaxID=2681466 RepID=UPI00137F05AE|nr:hypothetical protein [Magnetospirillum sp. LM-5]CAA7622244.1 hypothetical protein MTBLM5_450024 [Magnetospirillum sp. LM-5]
MRKSIRLDVRITAELAQGIETTRKQQKMRDKSRATRHLLDIGLARNCVLPWDPKFQRILIDLERVASALQRGLAHNAIPSDAVDSAHVIVAEVVRILDERQA